MTCLHLDKVFAITHIHPTEDVHLLEVALVEECTADTFWEVIVKLSLMVVIIH